MYDLECFLSMSVLIARFVCNYEPLHAKQSESVTRNHTIMVAAAVISSKSIYL